jgi:hypothetical protein
MGCQSAQVSDSVASEFGGNEMGDQLNFWHTLADRPITSNNDAFHGILLFLDERDESTSYEQRVEALKQRGLLSAKFNEPAEMAVRRGTVAVIFAKALKLRGGWVMHIFGPTPRYAVRELQYLSIFPYSSPQQTFSGSEFVGVIGALEDYQRGSDTVSEQAPAGEAL